MNFDKVCGFSVFILCFILLLSPANAAQLDVSVGVDELVYAPATNVTVSGYVLSATTHMPVLGASANVVIKKPDGSTLDTQSVGTNSRGLYTTSPVTVTTEGTYTVTATATSPGSLGYSQTTFDVEGKKEYTLTTNKYLYSPNETVTVTLIVQTLDSNDVPVSGTPGAIVPIKIIRKSDGTAVISASLQTDSSGTATTTYTIPINSTSYSDFSVIAGNGLAVALFRVPSFNAKAETIDANGANKMLYSSSDYLYLKVTASVDTDSGNTMPITSAEIKAYIINSAGTKLATLSQYTESPSGTYTSSNYSLSAFTNGEYTVKVDISKNNLTQSTKTKFNVKTLRVDAVPVFDKDMIRAFMKGENATLGLYVVDLSTGNEITGSAITGAEVIECKDSKWKDCMSEITSYPDLGAGFEDFSKLLIVGMPDRSGDFYLKVQVNTTSGNGIGEAYVSLQNIIVFGEIMDSFDNWRWEFGSGETVKIISKAFGANWETKTVSNVTIVEFRDDDWNDILSTLINTSNGDNFENSNAINFTAPQDAGHYMVKLKVITEDGDIGYAYEDFRVQKYWIWVDVKDTSNMWQWKFAADSVIDFYVNVKDLRGSTIDTTSYKVTLDALYNEMTGKKYNSDALNISDMGISGNTPQLRLYLANSNLDSGFYRAEFRLVDMDGNVDYGNAWFKISSLDVWVDAKTSPAGNYEWQYSPTDNITFEVTARYFNGTKIAGANVSLEDLMVMQDGPPMPVSTSRYTKSNATITDVDGKAYLWIKAASGKTLPQGNQMAMIKINASGTVENQEGWFDIRVIDISAQLERSGGVQSFGKNENISFIITAKKQADDTNINATARIVSLKDTMTWNDVDTGKYNAPEITIDSSTGSARLSFPAENLTTGQYEARIRVSATDFSASADTHVWFEVKSYAISGSFTTYKSSYAPGETVGMRITVLYPNGSAYSGANIKVYQFAETESWPWSFVTQVSNNVEQPTDANGIATISFGAPSAAGRYHPMINITSVPFGESKNPWEMPDFNVKSSEISISLYTYDTATRKGLNQQDKFMPNITAMANIITNNPETGEYANVDEVKLVKYQNLQTQEETTIDTSKTRNLIGNDNITFTTPTKLGDYILFVSVKENATGNVLLSKTWFRIDLDVSFFMDQWDYSKTDNVTVHIDSRNPDGTPSNITAELRGLKSWTEGRTYINDTAEQNPQTISGYGDYIIPIQTLDATYNFNLGEYEAELCIYSEGSSCTEESRRLYIGFSIQTFKVDAWPWQPSYTRDENVTLVFRADAGGNPVNVNDYNVSFVSVKYIPTDADATANFTLGENGEIWATPWGENFRRITLDPDADISTGEYMAKALVTKGTDTREREIWFKIAGMKLTVVAENLAEEQQWSHRFFVNENITLNISTGNSNDYNGTISIMDEMSWTEAKSYNITLVNGSVLKNISMDKSGKFNALVLVDTAEEFFWMEIGAYDIEIQHWTAQHDYGLDENVTIPFTMKNLDSTDYTDEVNVSIVNLRSRWDWSCVTQPCNDESSPFYSATIDMSGGQPKNIEFAQSLGGGEYDAEIIFSANGQEQRDGFGFNVRTSMFNVWMEMPQGQMNFEPGQNVTIWAYVAHPNGTSAEGVDVEIVKIEDPRIWDFNERNMTGRIIPHTLSATTDSNGMAQLKFTLNESYTGELEVAVKEYSGNQINHMMIMVSGYDVQFYRPWDKWRYMPGENYTAEIYVYKGGNPAANISAYLKSRYTDGDNWNNIIHQQSLGLTDNNGRIYINYELDSSKYNQNGHYMIEVDIGNGAARVEDWFKVESFIVEERTYGEDSYQREVSPEEVVVIDVYVKNANGAAIVANVTLLELRNPMNWQQSLPYPTVLVDGSGYTNVSTTDASGRATLKLKAPDTSNEYIAIINVSTETDSTITEAWFKVMEYSVNVQMMCADGTNTCNDANLKSAGGNVIIKTEVTGNVNQTRACLKEIRNIYTGVMTSYWQCNDTESIVNNSNQVFLNFMAPMETGEYEAVINIEVNKEGSYYEFAKEEWRWFRVMGEGGYELNAWIEPNSVWPSTNATAMVELWNPMYWEDINETKLCGENIYVEEIKDTYTWNIVKTRDQITQWIEEPEMCGDMPCGPPGVQLYFEVPALSPGEYEAKIMADCNGTTYERYSWFQVSAFQVSSLMPSKVKANQTVPVWLKVTNYEGTPSTNVTVNIIEIRNGWTQDIVKSINHNANPDSNGEVEYSLVTPEQPGEYNLAMDVVDTESGLMQKVDRWFRIAGMDIVVNLSDRNEFYIGEDINFTITIRDAMTGDPIPGANVNVNIWGHSYEDKMEEPQDNETQMPEGINLPPINDMTDGSGILYGVISSDDLRDGEYGLGVNVWTDTKGQAFIEESFVVNKYYLGATLTGGIDYNVGDVINVEVQANYSNGTSLDSSFAVEVFLENMMMKGPEEDDSQSEYNSTNETLDENGFAQLSLTIPDNVSSGPAVIFVELSNSSGDAVGWMPYIVILHAAGGVNYTFDETGNSDMLVVNSSEMFGVNMHVSSSETQMDRMVMHLKKTGDAVPMSQMMGGGPESNKEDWYESSIYFNATGDLHVNILARQEPGTYYAFVPLLEKGAGVMFGPGSMLDLAFINYRVI